MDKTGEPVVTDLHLVLKGIYYDAIQRREKTSEYRDNTVYWRTRIVAWWKKEGDNRVVLHRGYTKITMKLLVKDVLFGDDQIELLLGAQLKD